jgi:hypothetical protein
MNVSLRKVINPLTMLVFIHVFYKMRSNETEMDEPENEAMDLLFDSFTVQSI